jgi:hypothetical protein
MVTTSAPTGGWEGVVRRAASPIYPHLMGVAASVWRAAQTRVRQ